jgi:hypothetical protein
MFGSGEPKADNIVTLGWVVTTVVGWQRAMEACCSCDADLVAGDDLPLALVDVGLALNLVYLLGLDVEVPLTVKDGKIREELG